MMTRMTWTAALVFLASVAAVAMADAAEEKDGAAEAEGGSTVEVIAQPAGADEAKATARTEAETLLKTPEDRLNYALGVDIMRSFKTNEIAVNVDVFVRAVTDELEDGTLLMSDREIQVTLAGLRTRLKALYNKRRAEKEKQLAVENKAKADAFLARNAKAEGVVTLPSGLQYKVLREGTGALPVRTDRVTVHYRGAILDGTEFDSSYQRKKPSTFRVAGVVQGWQEALQRMNVGSKWQLWIPPHLAYGPQSRGRIIGPNELLVFEVELLGVEKRSPPAPKPDDNNTSSDDNDNKTK